MSHFVRNLGAKVSTPLMDRENIVPGHSAKDLLTSGRKHLGPKQAFGELKNTFHNQQFITPVKSNVKPEKRVPFKTILKNETPGTPQRKKEKFYHYKENLDYIWAEKAVMRDDEIKQILSAKDLPREKRSTHRLQKFDILLDEFAFKPERKKHQDTEFLKADLVLDFPKDDIDNIVL